MTDFRDDDGRVSFFISYTHQDEKWAEWIAWQLEKADYSTRLQAWDFRPGSDFIYNMNQGVSSADRLLAVLSEEYQRSLYAFQELAAVLAQDPVGLKGRLLPVRIEDFEPTGLLASRVYVDLVGTTHEKAVEQLLNGVRVGRVKPPVQPPFPQARRTMTAPSFPPTLARVWHVPSPRNPEFIGREGELSELGRLLRESQSSMVVVTGAEGIGKGALVKEYLYRHAHDYDIVWWVRARTKDSLAADYQALARALRLPAAGSGDLAAVITAVHRWQEKSSGWLMVYDHLSADVARDRSTLPDDPKGSVIVTTEKWSGDDPVLRLGPLPRKETVAALRNVPQSQRRAEPEQAYDDAGGNPLALRIRQHGPVDVPRSQLPSDAPAKERVSAATAMAYDLALTSGGTAASLLNVCAFLAPDRIPFTFFDVNSHEVPNSRLHRDGAEAIDAALGELSGLALVNLSRRSLSVNASVQEATRERLVDQERRAWAHEALLLVDAHMLYDHRDIRFWQNGAALLPHARAAVAYAQQFGAWSTELGRLLHKAATFLVRSGEVGQGLTLYRQALTVARRIVDRRGEAVTLNSLGHGEWRRGPWQEAIAHYEEAFRLYGELGDRRAQALTLSNLALVRWDQGRWARAMTAYTRVLVLLEGLETPDAGVEPPYARPDGGARTNLGHIYWDQGRWTQAIECYETARRGHARAGERRGEARALNCRGLAQWDAGSWLDALESHQRARDIQRADGDVRGEAATLNFVAYVYAHQGRWQIAHTHLDEAERLAAEIGDLNLQAIARHYRGITFTAAGRLRDAAAALSDALGMVQDLQDEHGEATVRNSQGYLYALQGEFHQANDAHQRSLDIDRRYGARHGMVMTHRALAVMHTMKGSYTEARMSLRQAARQAAALGTQRGEAMILNDVGMLRWCEGDFDRAQRAFERSLQVRRRSGSVHAIAIARNNLACCLVRRGLASGAARALVRSYGAFQDLDSRNREAATLLNLAVAYRHLGRAHRGTEYEQRALEVNTQRPPGTEPDGLRQLRAALDDAGAGAPAFGDQMVLLRDIRGRHGEAFTLGNLGLVCFSIGRWHADDATATADR